MGGQITIGAPGLPPAISGIRGGQLRLLAVWSPSRISAFPEVPTVREATGDASLQGLSTWYGFLLPAGVPPTIAKRLETAIIAALQEPEVTKRLAESGATVVAQPSAAFDAANREQSAAFAAVFKKLNINRE
jgi:tripartite-type tricarboxylate transporter receptor subunit TctC